MKYIVMFVILCAQIRLDCIEEQRMELLKREQLTCTNPYFLNFMRSVLRPDQDRETVQPKRVIEQIYDALKQGRVYKIVTDDTEINFECAAVPLTRIIEDLEDPQRHYEDIQDMERTSEYIRNEKLIKFTKKTA